MGFSSTSKVNGKDCLGFSGCGGSGSSLSFEQPAKRASSISHDYPRKMFKVCIMIRIFWIVIVLYLFYFGRREDMSSIILPHNLTPTDALMNQSFRWPCMALCL